MARWLVTQRDRQFTAKDLAELKKLAGEGQIGPGDMIQPPGASDWLYAIELPELKGLVKRDPSAFDDDFESRKGMPVGALAAIAIAIIAGGGYFMYDYAQKLQAVDLELLGENGLQLTEMLVTAETGAQLFAEPEGGSASSSVAKNEKVQLLAKRKALAVEGQPGEGRYQIRTATGTEGWVEVDAVVPAYFFADKDTRKDYDPIYNADNYVFVKNASWMQLPDQRKNNITVFEFLLQNKSKFDMTDVILLATIKDKRDRVLETKEVRIEGTIKRFNGSMVGTLQPERGDKDGVPRLMTTSSFNELAKDDPDMQMRWSSGIEVQMESDGFVEANIDLLQVRAVARKLDE
ncbi:MAG: hypothetical protein VX265_15060 [Myxococcota bacterium]|nr:hypothetical protein [Myxococcota bacterium]MEC8424394.1 hypothetical protein [Myxococcota bacterium]